MYFHTHENSTVLVNPGHPRSGHKHVIRIIDIVVLLSLIPFYYDLNLKILTM